MSLEQQLQADMTGAMRARDELRLSTLRMARSALQYARVNKRAELNDDDVLAVLNREAKQRRESAYEFRKGGRPDLAEKEEAELAIIVEYLPTQLEEHEIAELVESAVAESGASSPRELGKVMALLSPKVKGRADGRLVSDLVRRRLGG